MMDTYIDVVLQAGRSANEIGTPQTVFDTSCNGKLQADVQIGPVISTLTLPHRHAPLNMASLHI